MDTSIVPPLLPAGMTSVSEPDVKSAGAVAVPGVVDHGTETALPDGVFSVKEPDASYIRGDIDGDGDLDVYVHTSASAPSELYVNNGTGYFTEEAAALLNYSIIENA